MARSGKNGLVVPAPVFSSGYSAALHGVLERHPRQSGGWIDDNAYCAILIDLPEMFILVAGCACSSAFIPAGAPQCTAADAAAARQADPQRQARRADLTALPGEPAG